jgi:hypothetical protein
MTKIIVAGSIAAEEKLTAAAERAEDLLEVAARAADLVGHRVLLTRSEVEVLLTEAAKRGAREAVTALLGIDPDDSRIRKDLMDLRDLLDAVRALRLGTIQTFGRFLGYAFLVAVGAVALNVGTGAWNPFKH